MIVLYHHKNQVKSVDIMGKSMEFNHALSIASQLLALAEQYPNVLLVWCDEDLKERLNTAAIPDLFHHKRMLHSYGGASFLGSNIGFVENSPFVKVNQKQQYPTWQMHASVGGIHSNLLNAVAAQLVADTQFEYFLNSLAKRLMPLGIFCYHSPKLLKNHIESPAKQASTRLLFRFVKQHYKTPWVFFLFINLCFFKKQFPVLPLFFSLFYKKRSLELEVDTTIPLETTRARFTNLNIDVIIPTIGRTHYVKSVIKDLANQTHLPKKVIVIEQHPDASSVSALDAFLNSEWPFEVKHIFTHQTGACQARNKGLKEVTAAWVFLADDDIELTKMFLQQAGVVIQKLAGEAITFSCLQKHEQEVHSVPLQWATFGSGCSIVKTSKIHQLWFDEAMEYGYGEDADFGMQLRNKGVDVLYAPKPSILHLKAPLGGFRTKPVLPWHQEEVAPKPSPTIMRFYQKHRTREQRLGYKTSLFLKYYRKQEIKNPFKYIKRFKKQWNTSLFWSDKLAKNSIHSEPSNSKK